MRMSAVFTWVKGLACNVEHVVIRRTLGNGPRLHQVQSQALIMTPQLQQAIKLLQMNNLELNIYIDHELE